MKFIPVNVVCHAGYKADEYPVLFYRENKKYEIAEITDRWYHAEYHEDSQIANYFKVLTSQNEIFILKHVIDDDAWLLVI